MARYIFTEAFKLEFVKTCRESASMAQAAVELGMNYKTLCFHAKRLGCFLPNQAGKGARKKPSKAPVSLMTIFSGRHKTYQSHKLKIRLIKEGIKRHVCESCELTIWQGKPIPLELHHQDGNRFNNSLENLKLLCPNCHALTDNYRAKNIRSNLV